MSSVDTYIDLDCCLSSAIRTNQPDAASIQLSCKLTSIHASMSRAQIKPTLMVPQGRRPKSCWYEISPHQLSYPVIQVNTQAEGSPENGCRISRTSTRRRSERVELLRPVECMSNDGPVNKVFAVPDGMPRKGLECRSRDEVVVSDMDNGRVWVPTR
jgi:hypothetical protein